MSIDEMETVWREQTVEAKQLERWHYWAQRARTSSRMLQAVLGLAFFVTVLGFCLKVHRILIDPETTLANSGVDLLISLVAIIFASLGIRYYFRSRRELASLADDPIGCIEHLIRGTKQEIQDMRWRIPGAICGILFLAGLSKWQSISTGYETFGNAVSGLILIVFLMLIVGSAMFHRLKAFLEPRMTELDTILREFRN